MAQQQACGGVCRPPALVTQEEVEAEREHMRAVDARPIKKVAEAKARKRKRLQVGQTGSTTACWVDPCCLDCNGIIIGAGAARECTWNDVLAAQQLLMLGSCFGKSGCSW